jgi:SAM-dependent methyltransferase
MSWDPVWENIYRTKNWGIYPTEELIRFIARNYYDAEDRKQIRILDLGCGVGSATWYLCREGFTVHAVDGSETAIALLKHRLDSESLQANLSVADISRLSYPDGYFDCVVDLVCLMCNDRNTTSRISGEVARVLKPGGRFFSYNPRVGCWGDGIGKEIGTHTFQDSPDGPFAHMGVVRFTSEEDIPAIYAPFQPLQIDYAVRSVNGRAHEMAFWVVAGQKN